MLIGLEWVPHFLQIYGAKGGIGIRSTVKAPIGQPAVFVRQGSPVLHQFKKELELCGILERAREI